MMQGIKYWNNPIMSEWPRSRYPRGRRRQSPPSILRRHWDSKAAKTHKERPDTCLAKSFTSLCPEPVQYPTGDTESVTDHWLTAPGLLSTARSDDGWEHLASKEGESGLRSSPAPSMTSDRSFESRDSDIWDPIDGCPARTETMDTQASTTSDMARCQNSEPSQVVPYEWHDRVIGDLGNPASYYGDSDSQDPFTPSDSSDDELDFNTEAEADAWLVKHFNEEEVQNIKAAWTWSAEHGTWIHYEEETGDIIEWPKDLV